MMFSNIKSFIDFANSHKTKALWATIGVVASVGAEQAVGSVYKFVMPDLDDTKHIIDNQKSNFKELQLQISTLGQEGKIDAETMKKIEVLLRNIKDDTAKISSVTTSLSGAHDQGYCSPFSNGGVVLKEGGGHKVDDGYTFGLVRFDSSGEAIIGYTAGNDGSSYYRLRPGEGTSPFEYRNKSCRYVFLGSEDKVTGAFSFSCHVDEK